MVDFPRRDDIPRQPTAITRLLSFEDRLKARPGALDDINFLKEINDDIAAGRLPLEYVIDHLTKHRPKESAVFVGTLVRQQYRRQWSRPVLPQSPTTQDNHR